MFRDPHMDAVRQDFADQFLGDERGFIYRKDQTGVPIRVSKIERDRFVTKFNKRMRYMTLSYFPVTVGLILSLVWLGPDSYSPSAWIAAFAGIAAMLVPYCAFVYWAWNAPSRELERRAL